MDFTEFKKRNEREFIKNCIILYVIGILLHLIPFSREFTPFLTPWFLFFLGIGVLFFSPYFQNPRWYIWCGATFIATLASEIIGVNTAILFGAYSYSGILGISFAGAPLLIGFNWVIVLYGAINGAMRITRNPVFIVLLSGLICFIFDFVMEPAAITLGYWAWEGGVIPLKNYLTWTGIALIFSALYIGMGFKAESKTALIYLELQFIFFLGLSLFFILSGQYTIR